MDNLSKIDSCLACGCKDLVLTLDLQDQPLANSFQEHAGVRDTDMWFPLAINRCTECNHLQLTHAVNPELIYKHYLYVSGTSNTYVEYMTWYANFVTEQFTKPLLGTVLDIGCNDGSQLDAFKNLGFMTFGIDPAENLHPISSSKHIQVWCDFFNKESAKKIHHQFTVITTQNAFAHIPDPLTYLKLCKDLLRDDGKIFISTSQADMVLNGEFDTIYHEHISYYNAESMRRLAERAGLHLIDVVKTPIHGTSYIFILAKQPANEERMRNILAMEILVGLQTPSTYTNWAEGVKDLLVRLKEQIDVYRQYYTVAGYGAAAKGMTLINASDIHLDYVIDDNPLKQGLYCPGTTIPVVSIDVLDQIKDPKETVVFIPLAWNFYNEIKQKIKAKRDNPEDIFLRYFPTLKSE